jgi:hypothetical protein
MLPPTLAAHIGQQHGLFTAAQVRAAGITDDERHRLVRGGLWRQIRRGIYIEASTWQSLTSLTDRHRIEVIAAQLAVGRPSWASGHSAFVVHRARPPFAHHPVPELICRDGQAHRSRILTVRVWPLTDEDVDVVEGVPVLCGARTAFDAARLLSFSDAVVVTDTLLRDQRVTSQELATLVDHVRGRVGAPRFARVVGFADVRSGSAGESMSRVWFAEMGMPAPDLQVEFHDDDGLIGFTDFYWKHLRTIGEFDGRGKYEDDEDERARTPSDVVYAEKRREDRLRVDNEVVRFSWGDVRSHPTELRARFHRAFARGQQRGPWTSTWIVPPHEGSLWR